MQILTGTVIRLKLAILVHFLSGIICYGFAVRLLNGLQKCQIQIVLGSIEISYYDEQGKEALAYQFFNQVWKKQ